MKGWWSKIKKNAMKWDRRTLQGLNANKAHAAPVEKALAG